MDIDANLFLNFVPIICVTFVIITILITIFYKLKNRWPITVNCWFCNVNTKVPRQSLDWWFCSHCEQYNGFTKDGDYNYEISEQYEINNKSNSGQEFYCKRKNLTINLNSLCKQCNKNEEIKLLKLREFENFCGVYNENQISKFEKSVEKKFPLCLKCQSTVQIILHRQSLWLAQYKMLLFKQKPIRRIIQNREKIEKVLRILLSIHASVVIYFTEIWYLPLCGIMIQLAACLISSTNKWQSDIFPILGWICLIMVKAFSFTTVFKMLKIYSNIDWISSNDNAYKYFIITLGTIVGLSNLQFQSYKRINSGSLSFKKLEPPKKDISTSRSPSPDTTMYADEKTILNKKSTGNLYLPVNIVNTLITPEAVQTPTPIKLMRQRSSEENIISSNYLSKSSTSLSQDNSVSKTIIDQNSLDDSLSSLNSLCLGTRQKISPFHTAKIFEMKVYDTATPDIFSKHFQKRSILAPSKLRSVTQTSWVAGGYWQSGINIPTLSRSSSQSSGFGSLGSNFGISREPSVHEYDQCSAVSEQNYFTRPESPLSSKNSITGRSRNCLPKWSQTNDIGCSTETLKYHVKNNAQCMGHTTIVTNPVWLPALLCGSLVFNMMILCIILLRQGIS